MHWLKKKIRPKNEGSIIKLPPDFSYVRSDYMGFDYFTSKNKPNTKIVETKIVIGKQCDWTRFIRLVDVNLIARAKSGEFITHDGTRFMFLNMEQESQINRFRGLKDVRSVISLRIDAARYALMLQEKLGYNLA